MPILIDPTPTAAQEHAAAPAYNLTLAQAREIKVAGERPALISISRSEANGLTEGSALIASVRINLSADGLTLIPIWSAQRIRWDAGGAKQSAKVDDTTCPVLLSVVESTRDFNDLDATLPTESRPIGSVPHPPRLRMHRSYEVWTRSMDSSPATSGLTITYDSIGGLVADWADRAEQQLDGCFALAESATVPPDD